MSVSETKPKTVDLDALREEMNRAFEGFVSEPEDHPYIGRCVIVYGGPGEEEYDDDDQMVTVYSNEIIAINECGEVFAGDEFDTVDDLMTDVFPYLEMVRKHVEGEAGS